MKEDKQVKIGLALGGGGALGMGHVGVLEVLEEHGIKVDFIAGTSMGAIIGGAYASNVSTKEMHSTAEKLKTIDLLDVNLKTGALLSGKSAEKIIKNIIKVKTFEELTIPFACTSCNLLNGERVVLNKGDLVKSIRASMSVPGVFRPVEEDGMCLVDGGLMGNVPADVVKDMGADIVIAVNVLGKYEISKPPKNLIATVLNTIFLQQSVLTERCIREENPDIYINLDLGYVKQQEFSKKQAIKCINIAREETEKYIPQILKLIEEKSNNK